MSGDNTHRTVPWTLSVSLGMPPLCSESCATVSPCYRGKPRHRPTEAELGFGRGSVWLGFIGEKRWPSSDSLWVRAGGPMSCPGPLAGAVPAAWEPWPLPAAHTPHLGKWRPQVRAAEPAGIPGCQRTGPSCVLLVSSRVGQRGSGLSMSAARSEHEVSEIIDGLSEQEVSPPP